MQRYLIAIVMSTLALVYTRFATSGGARNSQVQVDEMQNATSSEDQPEADQAESAPGQASPALEDPCPCDNPICRPACGQPQVDEMQDATSSEDPPKTELAESATGQASSRLGQRPTLDEPCPCDLPICRPGCSQRAL